VACYNATESESMETEDRISEKQIDRKTKRMVVDRFLKELYGTPVDNMRDRFAKRCIDWSGVYAGTHTLLVKLFLGPPGFLNTEYYWHGPRGHNGHDRHWSEFSLYDAYELPSCSNDVDRVNEKLSHGGIEEVEEDLIHDLTERGFGDFMSEFEDFIDELYHWITVHFGGSVDEFRYWMREFAEVNENKEVK